MANRSCDIEAATIAGWSLLMSIRRIVPDITSRQSDGSRAFYVDFLGLEVAMDLGFIMTFVSPINPTAQISIMRNDGTSALMPNVTVEVADVDEMHARAVERRLEIVYPLTDEPWGVRRFFVVDPNGTVVNVMSHLPKSG
jgi:catechol 2,3-dioxygenase-like lactoylglutathione lyase family enzyme